ncbi:hypothetical protein ECC02_006723 [Trypanosoma cruzi]|uniref:Uncharacterized protein n=1 Tax=Trypanosoma cruzi TaxID=5693 RepID=A0A7J6Y0T3_TRYCR|nr:hypothetical protein ECC02_006723 [Trypanosoma cruzi]
MSNVAPGSRESAPTPAMTMTAAGTLAHHRIWWPRVIRVGSFAFILLAFVMFVLGMSGKSHIIVRVKGWDEVFAVVGTCCFFHPATVVYQWASRMPCMARLQESRIIFHALQFLLSLAYLAQQTVLMAYLVLYFGPFCLLFLISDIAIAAMMAMTMLLQSLPMPIARHWPAFYVLGQAGKLVVLWSALGEPMVAAPRMGVNGLLGTLMLTIPVVQFPVLISRIRVGMSLTKAYTTNMAAVFAHVLHFMDVLELYFTGVEVRQFSGNVKLLVLFFAVMGHITCNLYYASLFFKDEETVRFLRRFEEPRGDDADLIARTEQARDDELFHYFLWTFFFIDLLYAVMRLVLFVVNGTDVSVFLGKNFMMIVGVVMLLVRASRP